METMRLQITTNEPDNFRLVHIPSHTAYRFVRDPSGAWTWQVDTQVLITPNRPPS